MPRSLIFQNSKTESEIRTALGLLSVETATQDAVVAKLTDLSSKELTFGAYANAVADALPLGVPLNVTFSQKPGSPKFELGVWDGDGNNNVIAALTPQSKTYQFGE